MKYSTIITVMPQDLQENHVLKGRHFRIASLDFWPYMYIYHDPGKNISHADGLIYQMLLWLSAKYDFTFTLKEPPDGLFGSFVNNTWDGMIRMAINKEVDLIAAPIVPTRDRVEVLDFTSAFMEDKALCLIPAPKEMDKMAAIIQPFQYQSWIMILISMLIVSTIIWATMGSNSLKNKKDSTKSMTRTNSYSQHLLYTLAVICNQHQGIAAPNATRPVLAVWCLMSVILICYYGSGIISFLTVPKLRPIVNSVEELSSSNLLQVAAIKSSIFETIFLESNVGNLKLLGDSLRKHPSNRLVHKPGNSAIQTLLNKAIDGSSAVIGSKAQVDQVIALDYKATNQCRLSVMPRSFLPALRSCFALPKQSPYTKAFDEGISIMQELGLLDYWLRRYTDKIQLQVNRCKHLFNNKKPEADKNSITKPLTLMSFSGAFTLLLVGYVTAIAVKVINSLISLKY